MAKYQASIKITLRAGILDVQGKTVENALHSMDYQMIEGVRIGKYVTMSVEAESSEAAREKADQACKKLIANPIIEDYEIKID
jgi:phosphoribosylformylglycinamidine synthase PurS subunit